MAYMDTGKKKKVYVPVAERRALPIIGKPEIEAKLVCHIMDRLALSSEERNRRVTRLTNIDIQLSGYVTPTREDGTRKSNNEAGKAPKPTDHNLPLALAQIDEAVTYLMTVFAPESDIFEAVAPADKQSMAQAVTSEINRHGQKGQYYRNLAKFVLNGIKYNFGALTCYWEKYEGIVFKGTAAGIAKKEQGTLWAGNAIRSVDMYNLLYDTSVHPVDLPAAGEYFAEVEKATSFRLQKMRQDSQLFGIARFMDDKAGETYNNQAKAVGTSFYVNPPSVLQDRGAVTGVNWSETVSGRTSPTVSKVQHELVRFTGWLKPIDFELSDSDQLELWRIIVVNGKFVGFAVKLEDSHGQLPIVCATPLEDDLKHEQRSYAEQLIPLQHYASFLINTDQAATRKALGGITVYNPALIGGLDLSRDELAGARIPIRSSAADFDIDKAFRHFTDTADTSTYVQKIDAVLQLMQRILPTDFLKQVADLERATLYQAAATVQAGNRRHLKTARMISDQAMTPLKFQMIYNMYANVPSIEHIDDTTGERQTISIGQLIEAAIELEIGNGLKGIDRLMQIQIFRDILNAVIQSQQAIAEIDIVLLLNYFSTLAGDRTDLTQFRRKQPAPGVPAPQPGVGQTGGATAGSA
jgi:hypothetical protein